VTAPTHLHSPTESSLPAGLALVRLELIDLCPIQPRVNVSVDLVDRLRASMEAGRHQPLLEVEPAPGKPGRYQIVCGEQRWRAAKAAGLAEVLVRLLPRLGYLERLEKQYEENRLRADLDIAEEAHLIVLDKAIRDIAVAEQLLRDSLVPFEALDDKRISRREEFTEHLDELKKLLVRKKVHAVRTSDGRLIAGPLSPWRETEKALGISESQRKNKVAVLRLDADLLDEARTLPAEHAIQIAKLDGRERQAEMLRRSRDLGLTCGQVQDTVDRLRQDHELSVDDAIAAARSTPDQPAVLAFVQQLTNLGDLCRQLVRLLANLQDRVEPDDRSDMTAALCDLRDHIDEFLEVA
jgi:ParB-like chromosome segregation protein Spo0J